MLKPRILSEIEQLIIETSHSKDDPKELQMFSTVVQDNKRLKGKIEKYNVEKGLDLFRVVGRAIFSCNICKKIDASYVKTR